MMEHCHGDRDSTFNQEEQDPKLLGTTSMMMLDHHLADAGTGARRQLVRTRQHSTKWFLENLVCISDLPGPFVLPEMISARPNHVVILTVRAVDAWLASYEDWFKYGGSGLCKSRHFDSCPMRSVVYADGSEHPDVPSADKDMIAWDGAADSIFVNDTRVETDPCPSQLLAFGVTCPSALQATKRYLMHNLMVSFITPPSNLIVLDVTVTAHDSMGFCLVLQRQLRAMAKYSGLHSQKALDFAFRLKCPGSSPFVTSSFIADESPVEN